MTVEMRRKVNGGEDLHHNALHHIVAVESVPNRLELTESLRVHQVISDQHMGI